jgi:hypothetical protein
MTSLVLVLLCANPPAPGPEQQRVVNLVPFDVASCFPQKPALPTPPNAESVAAALRTARPSVLECLVDPKARGPAADTVVSLNGHTVAGTNLESSGKTCVEKAVAALGLPQSAPEAPIELRNAGPGVKLGVNAASDVAGAIRVAQAQWCDCYEGAPPATLTLNVKVKPTGAPEVKTDAAGALATCLSEKVKALPLKTPSEMQVPYTFFFLDSRAEAETGGALPELQFQQLDAIRSRKSAESALAVGARIAAVSTFDALIAKYNAAKKPLSMLKEIKARCADLVKADDALVAALEAQGKLDQHTADLAASFVAKNAQWKNAQDAASSQAQATTAEVEKVKAARDADAKVCPK